jgi:hypothetical protein
MMIDFTGGRSGPRRGRAPSGQFNDIISERTTSSLVMPPTVQYTVLKPYRASAIHSQVNRKTPAQRHYERQVAKIATILLP